MGIPGCERQIVQPSQRCDPNVVVRNYVHQPDDRRWDSETPGDRENIRRPRPVVSCLRIFPCMIYLAAILAACAFLLPAAIFDIGVPDGLKFRHENSPT